MFRSSSFPPSWNTRYSRSVRLPFWSASKRQIASMTDALSMPPSASSACMNSDTGSHPSMQPPTKGVRKGRSSTTMSRVKQLRRFCVAYEYSQSLAQRHLRRRLPMRN